MSVVASGERYARGWFREAMVDHVQERADGIATVLLTAMMDGGWSQLRDRVVTLLGGSEPRQRQITASLLDAAERSVTTAPAVDRDRTATEAQVEIRTLLRIRFVENPQLAAVFDALAAESAPRPAAQPSAPATQYAVATDRARIYQAGRDIGTVSG